MRNLVVFLSLLMLAPGAFAVVLTEAELVALEERQDEGLVYAKKDRVDLTWIEHIPAFNRKGDFQYQAVFAEAIVTVKSDFVTFSSESGAKAALLDLMMKFCRDLGGEEIPALFGRREWAVEQVDFDSSSRFALTRRPELVPLLGQGRFVSDKKWTYKVEFEHRCK